MKKIIYLLVMTAVVFNFGGCGKATVETETVRFEDSSDLTTTMYMGEDGWSVIYDEQFFEMNEITKGQDIELIYTDECKGSTYVELNEVNGKSAKELIDEKKQEYDNTSDIYEIQQDNTSGYVFYVPYIAPSQTSGNERYTSVEVFELKDGALVVTASQMLREEMKVSDRIADVVNSVEIYYY